VTAQPWTSETPEASRYKDTSGTNLNNRVNSIATVETGMSSTVSGGAFTQSSNTSNLTGSMAAGSAVSWTTFLTNGSNGFGGNVTPIDAGTNLSLTSGMFSVVDIFQYISGLTTTSGVYLGSLELGSGGSFFYTNFDPLVVAIPEPTVYAAILGAACLAFVAIRRRKHQILA
jgi:hypothetical protein